MSRNAKTVTGFAQHSSHVPRYGAATLSVPEEAGQSKTEMAHPQEHGALLRVAVVAGHVSYVEGLIEAKIEFRFGRDAQRFDL